MPDTTYYYIVGDESNGYSNEFKFTSAPLSSSGINNLTFAVFGDLGVTNGDASINYLTSIKDDISLVWHGGDVSYADDSFLHKDCVLHFCYEEVWDEYMEEIEEMASQIPYMTAPGNHEVECHGTCCFSMLSARTTDSFHSH